MKLQDKETLSIAKAVSNVLEKIVKEINYPHKMYSPDGKEVTANNKEEHEAYSAKGYSHEKPVEESPDEPVAKGEKKFKAKHVVKKSGATEAGTVVKEGHLSKIKSKFRSQIAKFQKGGDLDKKAEDALLAYAYDKGEVSSDDSDEIDAWLTNNVADKKAFDKLKEGRVIWLDEPDEIQTEAEEEPKEEESEKQKKYQAFFQKALKKFGVKSPAELEGDKKKEFFDYVDKNYKSGDE